MVVGVLLFIYVECSMLPHELIEVNTGTYVVGREILPAFIRSDRNFDVALKVSICSIVHGLKRLFSCIIDAATGTGNDCDECRRQRRPRQPPRQG